MEILTDDYYNVKMNDKRCSVTMDYISEKKRAKSFFTILSTGDSTDAYTVIFSRCQINVFVACANKKISERYRLSVQQR